MFGVQNYKDLAKNFVFNKKNKKKKNSKNLF